VFRHIMSLVQGVAGSKAPYVLAAGTALVVLAVVLMLLPPWRRAVKAALERGGWRGIVMGAVSIVLTLLVGAVIIEVLRGSLLQQSKDFDNSHGRISQTNYNAVKTNMGPPHEQGELRVTHFVTEEKTVYQYKDGRQIPEEEVQTLGADGDGGGAGAGAASAGDEKDRPERPIKRKIKVRREVPQNSIVSGQVDVDLHMNYRQKGSAYYACYDDAWKMEYLARNRSDKETEAEFAFPMPADQGVYNELVIRVDGKNWAEHLVCSGGAQTWKMPMKPGQEVRVQVGYTSRGMDYLRYKPQSMATRDDYKVTMRLWPDPERGKRRFVWKDDMSLPIGSMTPPEIQDSPADGQPMVLAWDLKSAATSLDMGVILPKIPPPGYYSARLLHEAPWGLVLLVAALVISWILIGRPVDLFSLTFLAVAYYLFYTIFAYLSDHVASFQTCFTLAAAATLTLAALYLWLGWGKTFAAHQTLGLVALLTVFYPLAVAQDEYTGVLVQVLYWALAAYAAALAVARARQVARDGAGLAGAGGKSE
jgi:hypothetical protein